jgi:starch phosphorylase
LSQKKSVFPHDTPLSPSSNDELSAVVAGGHASPGTLTRLVDIIRERFGTDVCSLYLLEPDRTNLVLAATVGLRADSVGRVRMLLTEGLAGLVAEELRPQRVADARAHPRFKFFPEAGEEAYRSFAGVPVLDRGLLQGVLVLQTIEPRAFTDAEMDALVTVAAIVGSHVSEARAQGQFVAPTHQKLWALAQNLWWSWDQHAKGLFREIDPTLWSTVDHNPIALLDRLPADVLEERCTQLGLHSRINYAYRRMQEYLHNQHTWASHHAGVLRARPVAYFSAEFGLHESLPIYSGGLGVLAGDHIKSASDLGVPLIGIGLYYDQGYFRQRLDRDCWQQEHYIQVEHRLLPPQPATVGGTPVLISIETRTGTIAARVWTLAVGRCTLLLLDSDVEGNVPEDRELTSRLYGGDVRVRIRQELLLGIGGVRALHALGISPGVVHLNEGHSAFATLELVRHRMVEEGVDAGEAMRRISSQVVFTTHTPVPAGHDRFSPELVEEHLGPLRDSLGIDQHTLMSLGRVDPNNPHETFCMTVVALKLSRRANAVSSLHGEVSRAMWKGLYPGEREHEVPIGHVTNGVHVGTWLATEMRQVYDRHLGPDWHLRAGHPQTWNPIEQIDDAEMWETHEVLRARLINFVRQRVAKHAEERGESPAFVAQLRHTLSPDALTVGFARRFATYKRANLILRDMELMAAIVNHSRRPVQFIFAGKAHPHDRPGKEILQQIARLMQDPRFAGKVVFVEDYDINVGRHLVQGVDLWVNNPRRPLEACGTSGEKVVLNGGLNCSILDGWWAEAYDGQNGFAIGRGETHSNVDIHDQRDGDALMKVLTDEVIPLFYRRDRDGLPREWIARVKRGISTMGWRFSADRMVMDYVRNTYIPAAGGTSCDVK